MVVIDQGREVSAVWDRLAAFCFPLHIAAHQEKSPPAEAGQLLGIVSDGGGRDYRITWVRQSDDLRKIEPEYEPKSGHAAPEPDRLEARQPPSYPSGGNDVEPVSS